MLKNSKKELKNIYRENVKSLYRFFYHKTAKKTVAEDLTSESFLKLAEQIRKGTEIKDLKSYLYGIAKIVFVSYLREKYQEVNVDVEELDFMFYTEDFTDAHSHDDSFLEFVKHFVDRLPKKQRIVLEMRLIQKMKPLRIAESLGKNLSYVKTTQNRGIKNLRKMLENHPKLYTE